MVRSFVRSMAPYSLVINIPFPLLVSDVAALSRSDTSLSWEIGCWIGQSASFGAGLPGRLPPGHSGRSGSPYSLAPPFTCGSKKATERRIAAPKLAETSWLSPWYTYRADVYPASWSWSWRLSDHSTGTDGSPVAWWIWIGPERSSR